MSWIELQSTSIAELFPIHNASWILQATVGSENRVALRGAMVERLRQLQLNASMSWDREHPYFGGWSYAPRAPRAAKNIAPFQQPNLSASVLAIAGLSSAGVCSDEPVMQDALGFVRRCQNLSARGQAPSKFDDGGFFQLHDDPSRNKAGPAGTEADGTTPQRSYTSASADGLRGLVMCGLGDGDREVDAARRWLDKHLRLGDVPDLRHYAAYSVADAEAGLPEAAGKPVWRDRVAGALIGAQGTDGSWYNPAGEMRENDPIVATPLAVLALA
jgi:squalene-hopene/tetraprenyl-beta-curcumene cyclase